MSFIEGAIYGLRAGSIICPAAKPTAVSWCS